MIELSLAAVPTAQGFDEFYGIPPDTSWDDAVTVPLIMLEPAQWQSPVWSIPRPTRS